VKTRVGTAGLAAVILAVTGPQVAPPGLDVLAVRFYRGGTTLVDGFLRVPYDLLRPTAGPGPVAYRVSIKVRDSAGGVLNASAWDERVPQRLLDVAGASGVEHFAFAAPPGRYSVEVTVGDSASGRGATQKTEVVTYGAAPRVSDLLLAGAMRRAAAGDTSPQPGEIRKGAVFITSATAPVLTPRQATLFYYVELYPGADVTVRTMARVMGAGDRQIIATAPAATPVGALGGVSTNGLDLAGLPPGDYRLEIEVAFPDSTVTRSAVFHMAGFEAEHAVTQMAGADEANDRFARMTGPQLDTLYAPLVHIMDAGERGVYDGLSLDGKRNYLRTFWTKRDPTPGTPDNEAQATYYRSINEANQRFHEGGAARIPGWRTDRGRIFIRYGAPDEVLRRPQTGPTPPYEVWKYTQRRLRKFVFLDETKFGNYALIYTDEQREPSRGNWEQILGPAAVQDVTRF
jgi:GWxTD domain-containing protein